MRVLLHMTETEGVRQRQILDVKTDWNAKAIAKRYKTWGKLYSEFGGGVQLFPLRSLFFSVRPVVPWQQYVQNN